MKIADILRVESDNKNCIHLIRDHLFWAVGTLDIFRLYPFVVFYFWIIFQTLVSLMELKTKVLLLRNN